MTFTDQNFCTSPRFSDTRQPVLVPPGPSVTSAGALSCASEQINKQTNKEKGKRAETLRSFRSPFLTEQTGCPLFSLVCFQAYRKNRSDIQSLQTNRLSRGGGRWGLCRREQPSVHALRRCARPAWHAGAPVLPLSPRCIALNSFPRRSRRSLDATWRNVKSH